MPVSLVRLPLLAVKEIIKAMEPLELLQLSRTSSKVNAFIRDHTRKSFFKIALTTMQRSQSIFLEHAGKTSRIDIWQARFRQRARISYSRRGQPGMYTMDPFRMDIVFYLNQLLVEHLDPHTIFYSHDNPNSNIGKVVRSYTWNVRMFCALRDGSFVYLCSKTNSTRELQVSMKRLHSDDVGVSTRTIEIRDSTWMSKNDVDTVMTYFYVVKLQRVQISDEHLSQILKSWKYGAIKNKGLVLELENGEFDFEKVIQGLGPMKMYNPRVEDAKLYPILKVFHPNTGYYQINQGDWNRMVVCGNGKGFMMNDLRYF